MDTDAKPELKPRMAAFALRVVKAAEPVPHNRTGNVFVKQMFRNGTGAAANYRAACRARSTQEFLARLGVVEEELDETLFWIDLSAQSGLLPEARLPLLRDEAEQLLKTVVSSRKTVGKRTAVAPGNRTVPKTNEEA